VTSSALHRHVFITGGTGYIGRALIDALLRRGHTVRALTRNPGKASFPDAVDVRQGSPTFLQWHAQVLGADNHKTLLIAEGFAHGFQTLTTDCEMLYLHTAAFQPAAEGGLNARDSRLAIDWPQAISELSPRDAAHPMVDEEFMGVAI